MDYDRERREAEARAVECLSKQDWRMGAYHLFSSARMTLKMAQGAEGKTRASLIRLAKRYENRAQQLMEKAQSGNGGPSAKLKTSSMRPGNKAVPAKDDEDGEEAWVSAQRPNQRLEDVAGMEEMKEIIESHILLPVKYADVYAEYSIQPGTGVLMYGPPGTGKTFIAGAIAGELDAAFIPVEMKKILSKWFGETEQLLADLFETARSHPRSIIFFDEAEALFPKRGDTNSSVMSRVVPQLLQLINGVDPSENTIIMLGATNRPWLMDEAATRPGRFGRLVYVGPPDHDARRYLFERGMRDTPTNGLDYDTLASHSEGYSGADIAGDRDSLCVEAKMCALRRTVEKIEATADTDAEVDPEPVTMEDFVKVMGRVKPSIKISDIKKLQQFRESLSVAS